MRLPRSLQMAMCIGLLCIGSNYANSASGVLGIYATNQSGKSRGGTAFVVTSAGDIVTAYHVVQGATSISLQDPQSGPVDVTGVLVRAIDVRGDIAVLTVPKLPNQRVLKLVARFPNPSENLRVVGYPRGMPEAQISAHTLTDAPIKAVNSPFKDNGGRPLLKGNTEVIPLDMTIYGGVSGAPLMDAEGKVVGVVSGSINEGGSFAWAIPIARVIALLSGDSAKAPLISATWPSLELLEPWATSSTRSYTKATESFAIRLKFREALAQYERETEVIRRNVMTRATIGENLCSNFGFGALAATQNGLTAVPVGLDAAGFPFAIEAVRQFNFSLAVRLKANAIMRQIMADVNELPNRPDMPEARGSIIRKGLQDLQLAQPELYSTSFEKIVSIDTTNGAVLLERLEMLKDKKEVSVSVARAFANLCSGVFRDIKRYEPFTQSTDDRLLSTEGKIFQWYAKIVDITADYLAFK